MEIVVMGMIIFLSFAQGPTPTLPTNRAAAAKLLLSCTKYLSLNLGCSLHLLTPVILHV